MPKPASLCLDTLDDRRQIHDLLTRLPPQRRIAFIRWACGQATLPHSTTHPVVSRKTMRLARRAAVDSSADKALALECYFDLWTLAIQCRFDMDRALERLVEMVRQQ
jgi:hypothetical protein